MCHFSEGRGLSSSASSRAPALSFHQPNRGCARTSVSLDCCAVSCKKALSFQQLSRAEHDSFRFRMELAFSGGNMQFIWPTLALFAIVLCATPVGGNEDCLWYVDKNGTWHNGFDCPLITFCCGNCQRRYCCLDASKMITERVQKRCMLFQFSPTTLAGIASSVLLFVAVIAAMVCCFMCSCCYLYQRRQQRGRTPYDAQQIPMASYPVEHMYDAYGKPLGPSEYPHLGYPMAPQYPGMPPQYPVMQPGLYPPQPLDPSYSQAPPPYSPPQYPGH
ncbi:protein shisa-4 isoform X2 [Oryzias latipes]|uniref:protein shisa-4 isoform X2 n=1 Tax=Oryzias latipes TaxID=8090 RepID=UPI0005CC66CE|nr:protein shisa-4 isoform X2 [Oryzias latipes]